MDDSNTSDKAYLMLDDGSVYKGNAIGKKGTVIGEICFDTNMTGYQEVFSDPSSAHKIVLCTHSHIGNYGCNSDEQESDEIDVSGVVCRNFSRHYSRKNANESLQTYLENGNVIGIENVDTRALVRKIRRAGFMRAIISSEISDPVLLEGKLKSLTVSSEKNDEHSVFEGKEPYMVGESDAAFRIALFDFGVRKSFVKDLISKSCLVKVFSGDIDLTDVVAWGPDGIIVYGGPGNPVSFEGRKKLAQELLKSDKPVLGIGLSLNTCC